MILISKMPEAENSIEYAIERVRQHDSTMVRQTVPMNEIKFDDDLLTVSDERMKYDTDGFEILCHRVKAPASFLKNELNAELRSRVLSFRFSQLSCHNKISRKKSDGKSSAITVCSRNNNFLGFARSDLQSVRASDVLCIIADAGREIFKDNFDTFKIHSCEMSERGLTLDLCSPNIATQITPGDIINGGIRVSHSFVGDSAPQIETFLLRLVCQNGAVRRECVRKASARIRRTKSTKTDGADHTLKQIKILAVTIFGSLQEKLLSINKMCDRRFQSEQEVSIFVTEQLRSVGRLYSQKLLKLILAKWCDEGGEKNLYAIWNAMTNVATHSFSSVVTYQLRSQLIRLAGLVGTRDYHVCPRCFRSLSNQTEFISH